MTSAGSKHDSAPRLFDGAEYSPDHDDARLTGQLLRIWTVVRHGDWHTLREIADLTGDPEVSISAQLRHLRKSRFGAHTIERRSRGERSLGLFEYRLLPTADEPPKPFHFDANPFGKDDAQ
jgi:hypothetical protein